MSKLELRNLAKIFDDAKGTETAVDDLTLTLQDGELLTIVGPSGCGKSTLLRMVAGLETVTAGEIVIDGDQVQNLAPARRPIAMVFQSYALYSQMTVFENMEYGLKHSTEMTASERDEQVRSFADLLGIGDQLEKKPSQLSGGQKQRVALGRAIVREPGVFLMDEPLSNLDAKLRAQMRTELQRIHGEINVTTLYVTHDQREAMSMADRIAILSDGILQQVAPPEEAYQHPANEFVATFLGSPGMNVFEAEVRGNPAGDEVGLEYEGETVATVPKHAVQGRLGDTVHVGLRPEHMVLSENADEGTFTSELLVSEYQGKDNFVHLQFHELEFTARIAQGVQQQAGDTVGVRVEPRHVHVFDPESGTALKTQGLDEAAYRTVGATPGQTDDEGTLESDVAE